MDNFAFFLLLWQAATAQLTSTGQLGGQRTAVDYHTAVVTAAVKEENEILDDAILNIYNSIGLQQYDLSFEVFRYAMTGYNKLQQQGKLSDRKILSIIDFTKPSNKKRFYTIDLEKLRIEFHTYVSHGKNTGENIAKSFSNVMHSNQSSLGFFVTAETYVGSKGYSLKLDGMEKGYNDKVRERAVVIHNADYVSESWIRKYGRLGRSQGCPALPQEIGKKIIDTVKAGTMIFAYYNDQNYLESSSYLQPDALFSTFTAKAQGTQGSAREIH